MEDPLRLLGWDIKLEDLIMVLARPVIDFVRLDPELENSIYGLF